MGCGAGCWLGCGAGCSVTCGAGSWVGCGAGCCVTCGTGPGSTGVVAPAVGDVIPRDGVGTAPGCPGTTTDLTRLQKLLLCKLFLLQGLNCVKCF